MTLTDPSNPIRPTSVSNEAVEKQPADASTPSLPTDAASQPAASAKGGSLEAARKRILIGSQRDPDAYRPPPRRDWTPIEEPMEKTAKCREGRANGGAAQELGNTAAGESVEKVDPVAPDATNTPAATANATVPAEFAGSSAAGSFMGRAGRDKVQDLGHLTPEAAPVRAADTAVPPSSSPATFSSVLSAAAPAPRPAPPAPRSIPKPSVREKLTPELEDELHRAMAGASMEDLLGPGASADEMAFESGSLQSGRVIAVRRDDVFVEFDSRRQGIVSLRQFDVPPRVGATVQVVVERMNPEDGLYELNVPNKAVQVDDWSDLIEGAIIEVRVTSHNAGGLECEVNHIRGFIPVSQIALYRVEDLAPFVDQRMACVITEADPDRRNLVLSRRAVLEREREQAKQQLLESLRPGQIRDGVVRKLMDFGAFVDLGGADGLLHISQLAWGRVKHPSDVLQEGQAVRVRVEKVDPETGKISLAYRDLLQNPWTTASHKYPPNTVVRGTVVKLMDFGAFVEVEPGIEGLVHISELSHKRVFRCSDVVKAGDQVEVMVLSVDADAQRMSLSMKELSAPPEPEKKPDEPAEAAPVKKKPQKPTGPLLGGLGRKTGDRFGLKW